jgi:hypothetical protein
LSARNELNFSRFMPDITEKTKSKPDSDLIEGTVMKSGGGVYEVDIPEEGTGRLPFICQLGGRLKKGRREFSQPVSVGDRVRVRPLENSGANARGQNLREGFIEELIPIGPLAL